MIKLKVNPNALTKKFKIYLLFSILFISCITTYSVASIYSNNPNEEQIEDSLSTRWVDEYNIDGIYDLKARTQTINIKNISNLYFTSACDYSNSMEPSIISECILAYIAPENQQIIENIKIGDIIIFEQDEYLICHRIDGYYDTNNERAYWTKGDNNKERDEKPVFQNDIIGIVVGIFY